MTENRLDALEMLAAEQQRTIDEFSEVMPRKPRETELEYGASSKALGNPPPHH